MLNILSEDVSVSHCEENAQLTHLGERADPAFPKRSQSSIRVKNGGCRGLVVLEVCSRLGHVAPLTSFAGTSPDGFVHRCACWSLQHARDLPASKGRSSVTVPWEQVSKPCWHKVTAATPAFPVCPTEVLGSFIASMKWDANKVFISEGTEQAWVPPAELLT